jgi:gas vesicle protein
MGKNKFFIGMFIGAAAGAAVSLLDRSTRSEMSKVYKYVVHIAKDPNRIISSSKELYDKAKETVKQVREDVGFIRNKVEELRDLTPQVKELITEAKDTFKPEKEEASLPKE